MNRYGELCYYLRKAYLVARDIKELDMTTENYIRRALNRAIIFREGVSSKADPVRDVEFRYGVDWARIDSPMQEGEKQ